MRRMFDFGQRVEITKSGQIGRIVDWQQRLSDGGYTYIIEWENKKGREKFMEKELTPIEE